MSGLLKYSGYFCSEEPTREFALQQLAMRTKVIIGVAVATVLAIVWVVVAD